MPVRKRIHCGTCRFCFCFFARIFFTRTAHAAEQLFSPAAASRYITSAPPPDNAVEDLGGPEHACNASCTQAHYAQLTDGFELINALPSLVARGIQSSQPPDPLPAAGRPLIPDIRCSPELRGHRCSG